MRGMKWFGLAAVVASSVAMAPATVHAVAGLALIDGRNSFLVDASANGRVLLVASDFGGSVIDLDAGTIRNIPEEVRPVVKLNGDGTLVYFNTTVRLDVDDEDETSDVYAYSLLDGTARLMTPGFADWEFMIRSGGTLLGDVDDAGNVLVTGNGPGGVVAPFFGDGSTLTQLALAFGAQLNGGAIELSDNGRYALYYVGLDDLYVEDRLTSTHVKVNIDAAAGPRPSVAHLSGDGRHVLVAINSLSFPVSTMVFVRDLASGTTVHVAGPVPAAIGTRALGISGDGTTVSLIQAAPIEFQGQVVDGQALFLWRNGTMTMVGGGASGNPPAFAASAGQVLRDGTTVVVTGADTSSGVSHDNHLYINRVVDAPVLDPSPYPSPAAPVPYPTPVPSPTPTFGNPSSFTPASPRRILDTRDRSAPPGVQPGPGSAIELGLPSFGVPTNATAVALQVTATGGSAAGYVSATPSGAPLGATSTLNLDVPGETISNFAIVPVGPNGGVRVFSSLATDVVVDLMGWWIPATEPVAAGRYNAVVPSRLLDTRPETRTGYSGGKPAPGTTTQLKVTGRGGVPSAGVSAVAVNITLDRTEAPGFVQAAPAEGFVPGATSVMNVSAAGQVVAATTIVPVDSNGRIALFNQSATDLIVDVTGWFTDETSPKSLSGLFAPATSVTRTLDTRLTGRIGWFGLKPQPGDLGTVSAYDQAALVGNVTITDTAGPGYVQLGPSQSMVRGATSNINPTGANETIANAFISPADPSVGLFTVVSTNIIIDVSGYMTR